METIKKIMVAIDLSEYSRNILKYTGALAKNINSELIMPVPLAYNPGQTIINPKKREVCHEAF